MRRTAKISLALVGLLGLMGAAAVLVGLPYMQRKLEAQLQAAGLADARVSLSLRGLQIHAAPDLPPLLTVRPDWLALLARREGLHLSQVVADCAAWPAKEGPLREAGLPRIPAPHLPGFSAVLADDVRLSCAGVTVQLVAATLQQDEAGLHLKASGRAALGPLHLRVDWLNNGEIIPEGTWAVPSLDLAPGYTLTELDGALEAGKLRGRAKLNGKEITLSGTVDAMAEAAKLVVQGDVALPKLSAEGLRAELNLTRFWPPRLPAGQKVDFRGVQVGGVPLTEGRTTFGLEGNKLNLARASAQVFGGKVALAPVALTLPLTEAALSVRLTDLDLAQILRLASVEGLSGTGRLSGTLPVSYRAGRITLAETALTSSGPGVITYQPTNPPAFLSEGGQGAVLGQVFSNFNYKSLVLQLNGTLGDNLTLGTRLEGSNPAFYNGRTVAFNLNLSGALEKVLSQGLQTFQLTPQDVQGLVNQGARP